MINFNNQDLICHIHCLGYVFYHQSMINRFCLFQKFLFSYLDFGFYSWNISNIYYSKNIFAFIMAHIHFVIRTFLFTSFTFYAHYYHLPIVLSCCHIYFECNYNRTHTLILCSDPKYISQHMVVW